MKKIYTLLVLCGMAAIMTGCDKGKPAATGTSTTSTPSTTATPDPSAPSTTATK
jgi:hypothetical protein